MRDDSCLIAIQDAFNDTIARLLSTSICSEPVFRHSLPPRVAKDDVIPLMTEIDEDLQRLQRVSEALTQIKTLLIRWKGRTNDARPIGVLPVELLSNIFEFIHDDAEDNKKAQAVVCLSHVTSSWRAITLAHGALWTVIAAKWDYARQDEWLKRSEHRPLHILAESNKDGIYLSPNVGVADRIGSIIAQSNYPEIKQLFPNIAFLAALPALQRIELNMGACDVPYAIELWILDCPRLQHVILCGVSFQSLYDIDHFPPLPWTELDITGGIIHARELLKLLGSCQQLRTLAVQNLCIYSLELDEVEDLQSEGIFPSSHRVLPLLEELDVKTSRQDDCIISFMSRFISTPVLAVLWIDCTTIVDSDESLDTYWRRTRDTGSMLVAHQNLITLNIRGHTGYISAILNILAPHTKSPLTHGLTGFAINCRSEREEKWTCIVKLITHWTDTVSAFKILDELRLELLGAPGAWHGRTISSVGLIRYDLPSLDIGQRI